MVAGTFSGAVQGGTLTDGTATMTQEVLTSGVVHLAVQYKVVHLLMEQQVLMLVTLTGGVAGTFSGALQGGSVTDGTATMTGGALTGLTGALTFSGTVTGGTLTDGTLTASAVVLLQVLLTLQQVVQYNMVLLSDGSITITGFVDEDNMASDSATFVPTQQLLKHTLTYNLLQVI